MNEESNPLLSAISSSYPTFAEKYGPGAQASNASQGGNEAFPQAPMPTWSQLGSTQPTQRAPQAPQQPAPQGALNPWSL